MKKAIRKKISHIIGLFTNLFILFIFFGLSTVNGQTTGSISGTVTSSSGTPISGAEVYAYSISAEGSGSATTNETGIYTIADLPAGDYRVLVSPSEGQNYIKEYYNNAYSYSDADLVTVSTGGDIIDIDFQLDTGATISGTVTDSSSAGIAGIEAYASSDSGGYGWAYTEDDGNYTIMGLPAGSYYIRTYPSEDQNYIREYYNNAYSYSDADLVTVSAGGDITGINFQLDTGATISGTVTDSSSAGIPGIEVYAYSDTCYYGDYLGYAETDENGDYTIIGLPTGDIYLEAYPYGQNYIEEWYNDADSCEDADPVPVVAGEDKYGIDFQLDMGGSISGTVYESDGTTPIASSEVLVLSDPCYSPGDPYSVLGIAYTNSSGKYTVSNLSAGEVYILEYGTMPEVDGTPEYIRNWYNSAFSCEEADSVTVIAGTDQGGIDFRLYTYTDSDNDYMPDQWEIIYFGDLSNDGFGDSDNDGVSDVDEYFAGTAPKDVYTDDQTDDDGGGGGGGIFGEINIKDVIGYHFDGITKNGTRIYMPVTNGFKALKGAQTHIERFAPALAKLIRGGFESIERITEPKKEGVLYWFGTHAFPALGKIAELYLDVVGSQELMSNAYKDTMISVTEFKKLHQQGIAISPHIVKGTDKEQ